LAETLRAALATITHCDAVPEQAPLHPTNTWSVAGAALRVTVVPSGNVWLQLLGPTHCSPVGLEVTVPEPPMETSKAAACVIVDDGAFEVPLPPPEDPPPPHAARQSATEYAAPERNLFKATKAQ
jgi:hypothetical protein